MKAELLKLLFSIQQLNIVYDDTKVLKNVAARSVPVETYNNFVLESEGLA